MSKQSSFGSFDSDDFLSYSFVEISIDPHFLNNFSNEDGIAGYFVSYASSDEFQQLKSELIQEVLGIIETKLTDKQREIVKMAYLESMTQNEIAKALNKHQTTVHKVLSGNLDYNNNKKRYGGALKKIRRLCYESDNVKNILAKMKEGWQEAISNCDNIG